MSGLLSLADQLSREVSEFDPVLYSGADCADIAERFARLANSCSASSARAARRAADCGQVREGPADLLARASGGTAGQARSILDALDRVTPGSLTDNAMRNGEISPAQAKEIAELPEHEDELLALARGKTLGAVKDAVRTRKLAGIDRDELHRKQRAARKVRHWKNGLGNICISGEFSPDAGVAFVNRLERETDREWRNAKREKRLEAREAHMADAFMKLVSAETGKRNVDLVLVADINAYRRGHTHDGEICHIIDGGPIPVDIVRKMAEDAFLKVVLHDGVNIHTIKHFGRYRKAELRTALDLGAVPEFDGAVCSREGCDRKYHLEWDHPDPVANRGVTSYDNQQPLCWLDHEEKTERDRAAGLLRGKRRERAP